MRQIMACLAATLLLGLTALFSATEASAASFSPAALSSAQTHAETQLPALQRIDYSWRRDYDDYDDDYDRGSCGYPRYERTYVCEQDEPRCFKQRECVWYYGREYCRYVRKCVGGRKHCKWVKRRIHHGGYGRRNCW